MSARPILAASIQECHEFRQFSDDKEGSKVTVVLAPIRLQKKENTTIIGWACSFAVYCHCRCRYAKGKEGR